MHPISSQLRSAPDNMAYCCVEMRKLNLCRFHSYSFLLLPLLAHLGRDSGAHNAVSCNGLIVLIMLRGYWPRAQHGERWREMAKKQKQNACLSDCIHCCCKYLHFIMSEPSGLMIILVCGHSRTGTRLLCEIIMVIARTRGERRRRSRSFSAIRGS